MDILIVSKPGRMRDGLLAIVQSFESAQEVSVASGEAEALDWLAARPRALVIIDFDLPPEAAYSLMRRAKTARPEAKFVLITDCRGQQAEARQKGAHIVLERGFSAEDLRQAIVS